MKKSIIVAYLLWFFFGILGIHKFYVGKTVWGIVYLLTGGLCGIGWFIDAFILWRDVEVYNQKIGFYN